MSCSCLVRKNIGGAEWRSQHLLCTMYADTSVYPKANQDISLAELCRSSGRARADNDQHAANVNAALSCQSVAIRVSCQAVQCGATLQVEVPPSQLNGSGELLVRCGDCKRLLRVQLPEGMLCSDTVIRPQPLPPPPTIPPHPLSAAARPTYCPDSTAAQCAPAQTVQDRLLQEQRHRRAELALELIDRTAAAAVERQRQQLAHLQQLAGSTGSRHGLMQPHEQQRLPGLSADIIEKPANHHGILAGGPALQLSTQGYQPLADDCTHRRTCLETYGPAAAPPADAQLLAEAHLPSAARPQFTPADAAEHYYNAGQHQQQHNAPPVQQLPDAHSRPYGAPSGWKRSLSDIAARHTEAALDTSLSEDQFKRMRTMYSAPPGFVHRQGAAAGRQEQPEQLASTSSCPGAAGALDATAPAAPAPHGASREESFQATACRSPIATHYHHQQQHQQIPTHPTALPPDSPKLPASVNTQSVPGSTPAATEAAPDGIASAPSMGTFAQLLQDALTVQPPVYGSAIGTPCLQSDTAKLSSSCAGTQPLRTGDSGSASFTRSRSYTGIADGAASSGALNAAAPAKRSAHLPAAPRLPAAATPQSGSTSTQRPLVRLSSVTSAVLASLPPPPGVHPTLWAQAPAVVKRKWLAQCTQQQQQQVAAAALRLEQEQAQMLLQQQQQQQQQQHLPATVSTLAQQALRSGGFVGPLPTLQLSSPSLTSPAAPAAPASTAAAPASAANPVEWPPQQQPPQHGMTPAPTAVPCAAGATDLQLRSENGSALHNTDGAAVCERVLATDAPVAASGDAAATSDIAAAPAAAYAESPLHQARKTTGSAAGVIGTAEDIHLEQVPLLRRLNSAPVTTEVAIPRQNVSHAGSMSVTTHGPVLRAPHGSVAAAAAASGAAGSVHQQQQVWSHQGW